MYIPRASNSNCELESGTERPMTGSEKKQQQQQQHHHQSQRPMEFSAEMLKDQELLVSTLSQQGISEALIRRQFNKLLEEQSKQLGRQTKATSEETSCTRDRDRASLGRDTADMRCEAATDSRRAAAAATSLLKQRLKREQQDSRSRNNGLQDLVTAAQIIDKSKSQSDSRTASVPRFRLNGAQENSAPEAEAFCRAHCLRHPSELPVCNGRRNVSSNGLENSRRQAAPAKSPGESAQHSHAAPAPDRHHPRSSAEAESLANGNNNNNRNHNHNQSAPQAQQPVSHSASFQQFSDIQEPRVFGGFTYFARKPQAIPQFACNSHQPPQPQQAPSAADRLPHSQLSAMHPAKCQRKSVCAS